mmetsp:Transcript_42495/g.83538  ORF Transcript_42495/g.83538 Transcript_42495/m.83538 type:complete len:274 (+) Transcript_42495:1262-2083(+)
MGEDEREGSGRCGEESRVLAKIEEGDGRRRSAESLETAAEFVPLGNRLGTILGPLHEQILEILRRPDGEAPIPLRSPIPESGVRLDRHFLVQQIENHPQRIQRRSVQTLENTGSHLERIFSSVVHPAEGVGAPPALDMRFKHQYLVPVFRRHGATRESAHAGAYDDYVVLAGFSPHAVSGSGVGGLFVFWLQRHVVRECHDLVAGGVFGLRDIVVLSSRGEASAGGDGGSCCPSGSGGTERTESGRGRRHDGGNDNSPMEENHSIGPLRGKGN